MFGIDRAHISKCTASIIIAGFLAMMMLSRAAICQSSNVTSPPQMKHPLLPSHGEGLLGVVYLAAGDGPHPTAVLFHGLPGFEQNLDLAQALRSAGWNVFAYHYRGTWGVKGDFSFQHSIEDAESETQFVFDERNVAQYHIDPHHVVVIGHSMGGFMAAAAAAHDSRISAIVMLSAWNIGAKRSDEAEEAQALSRGENLAPLAGTNGTQLAHEEFTHQAELDMVRFAPAIASKPVLLTTAEDGSSQFAKPFADALRSAGERHLTLISFHTDHVYSGNRTELIQTVVNFLQSVRSGTDLGSTRQ